MADVGIEYGVALYEIADEKGIKDEIYRELSTLNALLLENPEYIDLLSSPAIPKDERYRVIEKLLKDSDPYFLSYMKAMVKNNRVSQFFDAFYHYEVLYHETLNIKKAAVTTSMPLSEDEKKRIKDVLEKREGTSVLIDFLTDKSILGGIIIDVDGKKLDGSLKRKLNDIKKVMSE